MELTVVSCRPVESACEVGSVAVLPHIAKAPANGMSTATMRPPRNLPRRQDRETDPSPIGQARDRADSVVSLTLHSASAPVDEQLDQTIDDVLGEEARIAAGGQMQIDRAVRCEVPPEPRLALELLWIAGGWVAAHR